MHIVPLPSDEGQRPRPSRRRSPRRTVLTEPARRRVRAALENLVRAYGSAPCAAEVMGLSYNTVKNVRRGHRPPGAAFALHVAAAAGIPLERLLTGKLVSADRCPTCGAALRGGAA